MALVYESAPNMKFKTRLWQGVFLTTLPAIYYASMVLGAAYPALYPAMLLPSLYSYRVSKQAKVQIQNTIKKLWLLKNGDQVVFQTWDGIMHKLDIVHIDHHAVDHKKNDELVFNIISFGRAFQISNLNAKHINYDILDQIIHAIPIDTVKTKALYHHLIYKQIPANLRPEIYNYHRIHQLRSNNLNSNQFVWKYLNRCLYRDGRDFWLRRVMHK